MTRAHFEPQPESTSAAPSMLGRLLSVIGLVLSGIYLANIGAGMFGEIPDIIPGIGNLDEFVASAVFLACLGRLGINILPLQQPPRTLPKD